MTTTQLGAAISTHLFSSLGSSGTVLLRIGFAAVVLILAWRPTLTGYARREYLQAILFGIVIAIMNLTFYSALGRIPLGIAVTLEFVGPLGVAVAGSRRPLDWLWVTLAASGIVLLAPWGGISLDGVGVTLALMAGVCWAAYIILSARVGKSFPGGAGLTLAMSVGGVALLPVGVLAAGRALLNPELLLVGLAVALLSSVIPYSLELEALRTLPTRVFGVLMSSEPAIAAVVGFLVLRQVLGPRAVIAILLVTVATVGSSRVRAPEAVE